MKKLIKVNANGLHKLKNILNDIERYKESLSCPEWDSYIKKTFKSKDENIIIYDKLLDNNIHLEYDCYICKQLFPKIKLGEDGCDNDCPCDVYTPKHIIRRLNEIITFNE